MKIAFLILAHSDPAQLSKLSAALAPHSAFVHWDKKAGTPPDLPGAKFVEPRTSVYWGGFSQVEATIRLIRAALQTDCERLVLLSGSCYPLRPVSELCQFFAGDSERNYINAMAVESSSHLTQLISKNHYRGRVFPLFNSRNRFFSQVERIVRFLLNKFIGVLPRRFPKERLYHGSAYWAVTRRMAEIFIREFEGNKRLVNFYKLTFVSDEQFFHTVAWNCEIAASCGEITPYRGRGVFHTANLHIIDKSLQKWFGESPDDFQIVRDSDKYFVRKIRSGGGDELLSFIDKSYLSREKIVSHSKNASAE